MKTQKIFGVIGHPIGHSLSPVMHNAAFKELGLDYRYEAYDVTPEGLEKFLMLRHTPPFGGLNATVPHKVAAIKYMDVLDESAKLAGAVNTIKFDGRKTTGYNTDGIGCVRALEEAGEKISGKRILVLGAGGAARAIAYACITGGASVTLSNRTREKAMRLAQEIREKTKNTVVVVNYEEKSLKDAISRTDAVINTTTVGMMPHVADSPLPASVLESRVVVMDIVYNPQETRLLQDAKAAGCKTVDGIGMLVHQGAESLKIWLGVDAPTAAMKAAVEKELGA